MEAKKITIKTMGAIALVSLSLFSCQKETPADLAAENDAMNNQSYALLKGSSLDIPGRALASNCFQCHGTNGDAGELRIAGIGPSGIIEKFNSMKSESVGDNIMNVHAHAYTTEEMKLIGDFFSKQH